MAIGQCPMAIRHAPWPQDVHVLWPWRMSCGKKQSEKVGQWGVGVIGPGLGLCVHRALYMSYVSKRTRLYITHRHIGSDLSIASATNSPTPSPNGPPGCVPPRIRTSGASRAQCEGEAETGVGLRGRVLGRRARDPTIWMDRLGCLAFGRLGVIRFPSWQVG